MNLHLERPFKKPFTKPQLNEEFRQVMQLVCEGIQEFKSYDLRKLAISIGHSKGRGRHGVWAHVIPLRYVGGKVARRGTRRGFGGFYTYESPKITERVPDALYLMTFLVPRFFLLEPRERLETIVHELYHLHPEMRGDLRRFALPHIHHGPTPALYNRRVKSLTAEALMKFPSLLAHPLISGDGQVYEKHQRVRLPRPVRVFRPAVSLPRSFVQRLSGIFTSGLLLAFLLSAGLAQARVWVRTLREGSIYSQPSTGADAVGGFKESDRLEALRLSPHKTWVEVKNNGGRGWVPRSWVKAMPKAASDTSASEVPDDLPVARAKVPSLEVPDDDDDGMGEEKPATKTKSPTDEDFTEAPVADLNAFDAKADKYFAAQAGRLYEKASSMSARFGVVEKNDELMMIKKGPRWSQVRLNITGEEGFYPTRWIRRVQEERIKATGQNSIEGGIGYGSQGNNLGLEIGYLRNFLSHGLETRPRDRLEVGAIFQYWMGSSFSEASSSGTTYTASTTALGFDLLGRYLASSDNGRFAGGGEFGLDFHKSSLNASSITDVNLATSLAAAGNNTSIGILLGGVAMYSLNESWHLIASIRTHISSASFMMFAAGADFRF